MLLSARRLIGFLALVGVLLHAAALARHNAFALARGFDAVASALSAAAASDLKAALGTVADVAICHTDSAGTTPAGQPGRQDCPMCAGLVSVAMLAPDLMALPVRNAIPVAVMPAADERVRILRSLRPPARGPPATA